MRFSVSEWHVQSLGDVLCSGPSVICFSLNMKHLHLYSNIPDAFLQKLCTSEMCETQQISNCCCLLNEIINYTPFCVSLALLKVFLWYWLSCKALLWKMGQQFNFHHTGKWSSILTPTSRHPSFGTHNLCPGSHQFLDAWVYRQDLNLNS